MGSVLELELLLLVRDQRRSWTAADAALELRAPVDWVSGRLAGLAEGGVLAPQAGEPPSFRLRDDDCLAQLVDELADAYRRRRTSVISLIHAEE
ncbi:MAG: hypothetical protein HZB46_05170 [Solirubrobacterales bacterium]|nr:hypothetical protein [Solirubrobacterales bacterium]